MTADKLKYFIYHSRRQIFRFLAVGISTVFLDMISLIILKEVFLLTSVRAVVLNQILMLLYNFSLNKYWSFRSYSLPHRQFIRYLVLAGCNYLLSVLSMYLFAQLLGFDYRLVRLGTIAFMFPLNFLFYKYWVYREPYAAA